MAARLWHKAPFVRLLFALAAGIVLQRYLPLSFATVLAGFSGSLFFLLVYSALAISQRYTLRLVQGFALLLLLASLGALATWLHNIRNHPAWFGYVYRPGNFVLVTLEEPLVEKAASYKAVASVTAVLNKKVQQKTTGKLLLYFKKDSVKPSLHYGSQLLFNQNLQPIKNAGNPGSFDYQTYSLFQGITHQVYLNSAAYVALPSTATNGFKKFIYASRSWVVSTLKKYIRGKKEQGFAEAILIGYKDDLDRNLVQAYSNTGVVHIIAISGLHLGLIYGLLLMLTKPLKRNVKLRWIRLLLIIASLWLFSILAGGGPSVLRSALMFSLIAVGEVALRRTAILNTLAFSAFVLLCVNPFWLWDVGFQLSYAAVLSIVLFFQPIYRWFGFQNKAVDFVWKLTAVTLAAQILTTPISIYHFHQMPLLFLVTNFVAVPLSSLVLMGELFLCSAFFLPAVAGFAGQLLQHTISFLNNYIEGLNSLPFATWNFLSISLFQTVLLLLFVLAFCYWLLEKQRYLAWVAFSCFGLFMLLRGLSFSAAYRQKQVVVYNVPKHRAIDVINGRSYFFLGDSLLLTDGFERNFHLQPSRILHRISPLPNDAAIKQFALAGKQVLILNEALPFVAATPKQMVDVLVLSGNPKLSVNKLCQTFSIGQLVIDGSVPPWKAVLWKKDCDSLRIPCYNVAEEGAFVMNW